MSLIDQKLSGKLQSAGLSKKESIVYSALLQLGGAYPSKVSEITKLNRSTVYKILLDLSIKGLINEIQKGKKLFYQVEKPERLLRYKKDQIRLIQDEFAKVEKLIPQIEGLYASLEKKPRIKYFDGVEGVMSVAESHYLVEESYEMVGFANISKIREFMPKKFLGEYVKQKQRARISTRIIVPDTEDDFNFIKEVYKDINIDSKHIPIFRHIKKDLFPYKGEVVMYDQNKVSFINIEQGNPIGLIIEDQELHNMMKMIFKLAWAGAKEFENRRPLI
jgi:sugar-specific transcriptional regulator TrmB